MSQLDLLGLPTYVKLDSNSGSMDDDTHAIISQNNNESHQIWANPETNHK